MSLPKSFWDNPAVATLLPPDAVEVLRQLELRRHYLLAPPPLWVTPDDILLLQCRNSLAGVQLQVSARLMGTDGRIETPQFTLSPTSDRTINSATQALYEGYLLGASVAAIGATVPTRGQTFATLKLQRQPAPSNLVHKVLGADYVSGTLALEWPYGRVIGSIEGPGILRSVLGTAPAAGADWTQTVPTSARWRVRGFTASLTTSAVAGTRQPQIQVTDGVNVLFTIDAANTLAASLTAAFSWVPGYPNTPLAVATRTTFIPLDLTLFAGWIIRASTVNIQAGDQWTAPRFAIEEWLED